MLSLVAAVFLETDFEARLLNFSIKTKRDIPSRLKSLNIYSQLIFPPPDVEKQPQSISKPLIRLIIKATKKVKNTPPLIIAVPSPQNVKPPTGNQDETDECERKHKIFQPSYIL